MVGARRLHVVVRWGTSVLMARDVEPNTDALRSALADAQCGDLAQRLAVANGEIWVDDGPPHVVEGDGTQHLGEVWVEASAAVDDPAVHAKPRINRLAS